MDTEKAKVKTVELVLKKGKDGYWLHFRTKDKRHAVINMEHTFPKRGGFINHTIMQWAVEQFVNL